MRSAGEQNKKSGTKEKTKGCKCHDLEKKKVRSNAGLRGAFFGGWNIYTNLPKIGVLNRDKRE